MLTLFGNSDMQIDAMVQYGCFGLLAALVFWSLWKGIPGALAIHQQTMATIAAEHKIAVDKVATDHKSVVLDLLRTFEKEAHECREERMAVAETAAAEREKDRALRDKLAEKIQALNERPDRSKA